MIFRIRKLVSNSYVYSLGSISSKYVRDSQNEWTEVYYVEWSTTKGKLWKNEKLLSAHLLKAMTHGIDIAEWEIVEVVERPTKPINEWVDANMLMQVLAHTRKE